MLAKRARYLEHTTIGFRTVHRQVSVALERDLIYVLIWRDQGIRFQLGNIVERRNYRGGGTSQQVSGSNHGSVFYVCSFWI